MTALERSRHSSIDTELAKRIELPKLTNLDAFRRTPPRAPEVAAVHLPTRIVQAP